MNKLAKLSVPIAIAVLAAAWGIFASPLPQPQAYHLFADARDFLSIANAGETLSNLAFLLVGALGLAFLWREHAAGTKERFASVAEMRPWWAFFAGVTLTSVGSGYYHLAPDDARLVWDRLPMTIGFMSLVAAVVSERISIRAGSQLLWPLVMLGLASVAYWRLSALFGFENLRPYLALQFGSIGVVLAISILYRSRYTRGGAIFALAAAYVIAKVFESFDHEVFALGHWLSGHTLKHLTAAAGVFFLLWGLQRRTLRRIEK